jgi:hypothetical protein
MLYFYLSNTQNILYSPIYILYLFNHGKYYTFTVTGMYVKLSLNLKNIIPFKNIYISTIVNHNARDTLSLSLSLSLSLWHTHTHTHVNYKLIDITFCITRAWISGLYSFLRHLILITEFIANHKDDDQDYITYFISHAFVTHVLYLV